MVMVGGLARSDSGNFPDEFAALLDRLKPGDSARRHRLLVTAGTE